MENLALLILGVCVFLGFIAVFFTTVGTLVILIGAGVYVLMTGMEVLEIRHLIILLTLYLCGEAVEFFLSVWGAKRFGASNRAAIGALIGGIIGAMFGTALFGVGIFAGTLLGIFLGAVLVEYVIYKDWRRSFMAGTGGVLGRLGAIGVKLLIAIAMVWVMWSQIRTTF